MTIKVKAYLLFLVPILLTFLISTTFGIPSDQTRIIKIMTELMKKPYERSARPLYNEAPLYIRTGLFVHTINEFNEKTQEITVKLTLKQSWYEPRLTFNAGLVPNDTIQLTPEQGKLLWNPSTVIQNEQKPPVILLGHEYIRLNCEGNILSSTRMVVTIGCPKELSHFPFDSRTCQIILASYLYDKKDLFFEWENDQTGIKIDLQTSEFKVVSFSASANVDTRYPETALIFKLYMKRQWQSYCGSYFSPMQLFISVSLLTLWIPNTRFGIIVGFLNIPLMNLFLAILKKSGVIPNTPERTAIDQYTSLCYFFLCACLSVNLVLNYFERQAKVAAQQPPPAPSTSPPESPIPEKKDMTELIFEVEEVGQNEESGVVKKNSNKKQKGSRKKALISCWFKLVEAVHSICNHAYWILLVAFILCNIFYWGVYLSETSHRQRK